MARHANQPIPSEWDMHERAIDYHAGTACMKPCRTAVKRPDGDNWTLRKIVSGTLEAEVTLPDRPPRRGLAVMLRRLRKLAAVACFE